MTPQSSQQQWPQFSHCALLVLLPPTCAPLQLQNALWPIRPWNPPPKRVSCVLEWRAADSEMVKSNAWCREAVPRPPPRGVTGYASLSRSSREQQSVDQDPAAAQHPEEAQETPTQRVLHRRLRGDRRGYTASQNKHIWHILHRRWMRVITQHVTLVAGFLKVKNTHVSNTSRTSAIKIAWFFRKVNPWMICLVVDMHNVTKRVLLSVTVPQADPNTPKPEGRQIIPVKGEPLGVVSNWPPALQAALARWGATQGKSPALTALDITGRPLYTLTYGNTQGFSYADQMEEDFSSWIKKNRRMHCPNWISSLLGKLWSRSVKLAYTLLNKLGTKNEQILKPGDRVRAEWEKMWPPDRDSMAGLTFRNIFAGGLGVSQQRPRDVLGGLFWLSPGWSHTCSYWSPAISQGEQTPAWAQVLYRYLNCSGLTLIKLCFCRMQVSVRWGFCWAAVVLV